MAPFWRDQRGAALRARIAALRRGGFLVAMSKVRGRPQRQTPGVMGLGEA